MIWDFTTVKICTPEIESKFVSNPPQRLSSMCEQKCIKMIFRLIEQIKDPSMANKTVFEGNPVARLRKYSFSLRARL